MDLKIQKHAKNYKKKTPHLPISVDQTCSDSSRLVRTVFIPTGFAMYLSLFLQSFIKFKCPWKRALFSVLLPDLSYHAMSEKVRRA